MRKTREAMRRASWAAVVVLLAAGPARAIVIQDFGTVCNNTCQTTAIWDTCSAGCCSMSDDNLSNTSCPGGVLNMGLKAGGGGYFYDNVSTGPGYNFSTYDYISFDVSVSSTEYHNQNIQMRLANGTAVTYPLTRWLTSGLPLSMTNVKIPIANYFTATQSTAIASLTWHNAVPSTASLTQLFFYLDNVQALTETTLAVSAASMINATTVRVYFNVPVGASGDTAGNFTLSPNISITPPAVRRDNNRGVELTLASALAINTTYTVTVAGVVGANGATLGAATTATFIGHNQTPVLIDDFNRPDSILATEAPAGPWNSVIMGSNDNYVALSTVTTLYGGRSLYCADISTTNQNAFSSVTLASPPTAGYYRFYFYLPQSFYDAMANSEWRQISRLLSGGATTRTFIAYAKKSSAGKPQLFVELANSAGGFPDSEFVDVVPDSWNSLEIRFEAANPATILEWFNGRKIYVSTSTNFSDAVSWNTVRAGLQTDNNGNGNKQAMYIDELRVSNGNYIGQIEKPVAVRSATVKGANTVWVYLNQAVTADDPAWTNAANYTITPALAVISVSIADYSQAIALNTAAQTSGMVYTVKVNSALLESGAKSTATFAGVNPSRHLVDDFNRPIGLALSGGGKPPASNGLFDTTSPQGPWNDWWNDGASLNSLTLSSGTPAPYRGDFYFASTDANTSVNVDGAALRKVDVNAPGAANVRFYVYLPSASFFTPMPNSSRRDLGNLKSSVLCSGANNCSITAYAGKDALGNPVIRLEGLDSTPAFWATADSAITADAWHEIELVAPSTGNPITLSLYLDGTLIQSAARNYAVAGYWQTASVGLGYFSLTGTVGLAQTAYFDEVQISTAGSIIGTLKCKGPFTFAFTDPTLTAGVAVVRTVHIQELRDDIDSLRQNADLATYSWTDPVLTPGVTTIRTVHITELRSALDAVYTACSQTPPTYTDPTLTAGVTPVRNLHISELRTTVNAAN